MSIQKPINIGSRRELFWDDFLIEETSALLKQHKPEDRGISMVCDAPWEGSGCLYPVVIRDKDVVRLYYKAGNFRVNDNDYKPDEPLTGELVACCAESYDDGITFQKPIYGLKEFMGNKNNNIILTRGGFTKNADNFAFFLDTNPDCSEDERFKACADNGQIEEGSQDRKLSYYKSKDGVEFLPGGEVTRGGWYDSMNCAFWDRHTKQYFLYMRDWPEGYKGIRAEEENAITGTKKYRDIRYSVSKDFKTWSEHKPIKYDEINSSIELYTNGIKPYYRADHMFLGLSTRYVEKKWSPNFDHLVNCEHRKLRSSFSMRYGTAFTDGILLTSRDGTNFKRWDEAFITGGIERKYNWIYGDCYSTWGILETASDLPDGAPNEISFYQFENIWQTTCVLRRYALRKDGFISYNAPLRGAKILTKPIIFEGSRLSVNFATSAAGQININLLDDQGRQIPGFKGYDIFGDNLDRPIVFKNGTDVTALSGKAIKMEIIMSDADIYSFKFE